MSARILGVTKSMPFETRQSISRLRTNHQIKNFHREVFRYSLLFQALIFAVLVLSGTLTSAQQPISSSGENDRPAYSREFVQAYQPVKEALDSPDSEIDSVTSHVRILVAVANSPDEKLAGGGAVFNAGIRLDDRRLQRTGVEMMLASEKVQADSFGKFNFIAYQLNNQLSEYARARPYLEAAMASGFTTDKISREDLQIGMAELYFAEERYHAGLRYLQTAIEQRKARNLPIDEIWYRRAITIAYTNELVPTVYDLTAEWIGDFPTPSNWRDAINIARNLNSYDDSEILDLLRLSRELNALSASDYAVFVDVADPRRFALEVSSVIREAYSNGTLDNSDTFFLESLNLATNQLTLGLSSLPDLEAVASDPQAGLRTIVSAGDVHLSYGHHRTAIELYSRALGMSGVDRDLVLTRLGIAQAGTGDTEGALATFARVKGSRTQISRLWSAYVENSDQPRLQLANPTDPQIDPTSSNLVELVVTEATGPRIALIIGNNAYEGNLTPLNNPVNDASLIGATLRRLGFEVEIVTNADQREMNQAIQRFGDRLYQAGDNATGLFFFAGHGVQSKGMNFLIPANANVETEGDLVLEAISADAVLAQMEEVYVSTRIVILDACRNMPLRRRTRDGTQGLVRMETPNGSFVAYSTAPGRTADDGEAGGNSPFARALAQHMVVPGRPIEITFREVRKQVVRVTEGDQVPWDSSSLLDNFSFATN